MKPIKKACCPGGGCACGPQPAPVPQKRLVIDFLYLDLDVCDRCQGTGAVLSEAIADVEGVLRGAGYTVVVNRVHIASRELAVAHRFLSSPTLRVNGLDIGGAPEQTPCGCCSDLCGGSVDCRVWTYQGQQYTQPPRAMIVDALLRAVYGAPEPPSEQEYALPQNLIDFFDALERTKR